MGHRNSAASSTRSPAVGSGPNSDAPMRMNRNEAPHRAESSMNSPSQAVTGRGEDGVVALMARREGGSGNRAGHLQGAAAWPCGPGPRSEERRVGKSVDLGGRRIIKKKKKNS